MERDDEGDEARPPSLPLCDASVVHLQGHPPCSRPAARKALLFLEITLTTRGRSRAGAVLETLDASTCSLSPSRPPSTSSAQTKPAMHRPTHLTTSPASLADAPSRRTTRPTHQSPTRREPARGEGDSRPVSPVATSTTTGLIEARHAPGRRSHRRRTRAASSTRVSTSARDGAASPRAPRAQPRAWLRRRTAVSAACAPSYCCASTPAARSRRPEAGAAGQDCRRRFRCSGGSPCGHRPQPQ